MRKEYGIIDVKVCPICGSHKIRFIMNKYDDRFGQPDEFKINMCKCCGVYFLRDKIKEEYLSNLYGKYYSKERSVNLKSNRLRNILEKIGFDKFVYESLARNIILLNRVDDYSRVLEIGSGYNDELKRIILSKKLDWTGLEVDETLVGRLRKEGLKMIHGTMDVFDSMKDEKYDYIVLSQSIEHQNDINVFFENSKKVLKKSGRIIFTTPNADSRYRKIFKERWINWHVPYHVVLLNNKAIEILCKKYNFSIVKYFTYTPTSWYVLQRNFLVPKQGQINKNYNFNFSLVKQLYISLWLRIYEAIDRKRGDCIYCEIKFNG